MRLFRSSSISGIAEETLEFIIQASRDTHPNEFFGLLRATDARDLGLTTKGSIITDVLVIPGTKSSELAAVFRSEMVPMNSGDVGTVHSHPSGNLTPSDEDLNTFSKRGKCHIIIGHPYDEGSWRCYDRKGEERNLDVVDVELKDDDFFDFTEEDLFGE